MTPIFVPLSESKNGLVKLAVLTANSFPLFSSLLLALLASLVSSPVPSFLTSSLLMGFFWCVQHQTSNQEHQTSNQERQINNLEHQIKTKNLTSNQKHQTSN